jgi:hypothetical protein
VGKLEMLTEKALKGSPACGDMVAVYLKVDPKTTVIDDIKFESMDAPPTSPLHLLLPKWQKERP